MHLSDRIQHDMTAEQLLLDRQHLPINYYFIMIYVWKIHYLKELCAVSDFPNAYLFETFNICIAFYTTLITSEFNYRPL